MQIPFQIAKGLRVELAMLLSFPSAGRQFVEDCKRGDLELVRDHLIWGKHEKAIREVKFTGLMMAVKGGHTEIVSLLLHQDQRFNPNKPWKPWKHGEVRPVNEMRDTPIHLAAMKVDTACLEILLRCERINPNTKNREGRTPLMEAIRCGRQMAVEMLLRDDRVFPNTRRSALTSEIKDSEGKTSLCWAIERNQMACIDLLLPRSDLRTRDYHKRSAMEVAR